MAAEMIFNKQNGRDQQEHNSGFCNIETLTGDHALQRIPRCDQHTITPTGKEAGNDMESSPQVCSTEEDPGKANQQECYCNLYQAEYCFVIADPCFPVKAFLRFFSQVCDHKVNCK